jgi:hypothetical protein
MARPEVERLQQAIEKYDLDELIKQNGYSYSRAFKAWTRGVDAHLREAKEAGVTFKELGGPMGALIDQYGSMRRYYAAVVIACDTIHCLRAEDHEYYEEILSAYPAVLAWFAKTTDGWRQWHECGEPDDWDGEDDEVQDALDQLVEMGLVEVREVGEEEDLKKAG